MLKDLLDDTDEENPPQLFSTQTDTEDSDNHASPSRPARATFHTKLPKLIESLALIYLALVLMRLPICSSNFRSWVLHEDFVFLRAPKGIPKSMEQRLPATMRYPFEPRVGSYAFDMLSCAIFTVRQLNARTDRPGTPRLPPPYDPGSRRRSTP